MKTKRLLIITRSMSGRRRKLFELQNKLFGRVDIITKLGESLPNTRFDYNDLANTIIEINPDIIHVYIDYADLAVFIGKLGFPYVIDMSDCAEMRGQTDANMKLAYQNNDKIPKIFCSECHADYVEDKYGLNQYSFIPNLPLKTWLPKQRKPKLSEITGNPNIVYFGGILEQVNEFFGYRYYLDIFKIFLANRIDIHLYPSEINKNLNRYKNIGVIIHNTVPMYDLYIELSQYDIGFAGYNKDGTKQQVFDYAQRCLPNKTFDYMFAGIPTLAYDLGYAEKFVRNWGVCIEHKELLIDAYYKARELKIDYQKWQKKYCLESYEKMLINIYKGVLQ